MNTTQNQIIDDYILGFLKDRDNGASMRNMLRSSRKPIGLTEAKLQGRLRSLVNRKLIVRAKIRVQRTEDESFDVNHYFAKERTRVYITE